MAMPYEAEVERIADMVEDGYDLYSLVFDSEYTQNDKLFIKAMDSTMFPDAYIELVRGRRVNMDERTRWMLLAPTVVFFAMCAEVRWVIAERESTYIDEVENPGRKPFGSGEYKAKRSEAKRTRRGIDLDEN